MKWYLAEVECPICNTSGVSLHPEPAKQHGLECSGCGYMIQEVDSEQEVPESFARAEHERQGIKWRSELNG